MAKRLKDPTKKLSQWLKRFVVAAISDAAHVNVSDVAVAGFLRAFDADWCVVWIWLADVCWARRCRWRLINYFVMFVWITVVQCRGCRGRWRRVRRITDQASVGGRRAAGSSNVVSVVAVHTVSAQRCQPHSVSNWRNFIHTKTVQASRWQRCRCLILLRLSNGVSEFRPTDLQNVNDEEDDEHQNDENHDEDFLVWPWVRSPRDRNCCAILVWLVRPIGAMIPTVTEKSLRNANLVACTLEVAGVAAHRLVETVRAVGGSITNEALLDTFARVATVNKIRSQETKIGND